MTKRRYEKITHRTEGAYHDTPRTYGYGHLEHADAETESPLLSGIALALFLAAAWVMFACLAALGVQ